MLSCLFVSNNNNIFCEQIGCPFCFCILDLIEGELEGQMKLENALHIKLQNANQCLF